ncbi:iron uptake porin [Mastigocladopsis repens]|uniref:iron uptake porin n=1 Tax=Mastigocladopsis repens TaxID=221287 RepID=UPI0002D5E8CD|nr:iron uptake porin [Mastigocladopsis repens]
MNSSFATNIPQKFLTKTIVKGASLLTLSLLAIYPANAETSVSLPGVAASGNNLHAQGSTPSKSQVTNVNQLSDVQPTDWVFQALQSLVERYGCIAGYPNGTFRGSRAMTRYEFAAGLNACLNRINELIAQATTDLVSKEDLATLQRLEQEFTPELATLRGRVDALEAHTAQLQANQFSTTTKLTGQAIISVNAGGFSGDRIVDATGQNVLANSDPNPTVLYRVSLDFDTSFRGDDLLKIRLDAGSGVDLNNRSDGTIDNAAGLLEPFFGSPIDYSSEPPTNNDITIGRVFYSFKPTSDLTVSIGPDIRATDYADYNSYANLSFLDFSTQAFVNNLLIFPVDGPATGAAIHWKPGNGAFSVRALYAAADANNPGDNGLLIGSASFTGLLYPDLRNSNIVSNRGLFGDTYQGTVEVEYAPSRSFTLRLQYSGGEVIDNRFDALGVNVELALGQKFGIFGRYGYGSYNDTAFGDINPNYWMAGIGMRDLFTQGALAGIAVGQPFIASEIGNSTQTNFEVFYNYPFTRNIQVTPTIQVINNAGNQESNGTIVTGTLRTVFSF